MAEDENTETESEKVEVVKNVETTPALPPELPIEPVEPIEPAVQETPRQIQSEPERQGAYTVSEVLIKDTPKVENNLREMSAHGREKIQEKKDKRLEKVFQRITYKGRVTHEEIQKLLRVSSATATRYLDQLEKQGQIRQVGKTGQSVYYERL